MAVGYAFFKALFRRTSTFTLTVVLGAVFFERWYDSWSDATWERLNRGVRPRFIHIATCIAYYVAFLPEKSLSTSLLNGIKILEASLGSPVFMAQLIFLLTERVYKLPTLFIHIFNLHILFVLLFLTFLTYPHNLSCKDQ